MRRSGLIFTVLAIILHLTSFAEGEKGDSLIIEYNKATGLEQKTRLAIAISHELVHADSKTSGVYAQNALAHAEKSGNQLLVAEAKETIADYFGSKSNFLSAANVYLQALALYESLDEFKRAAAVSNNVANAYLGIDDYEKAEVYYKRAYNLGIESRDTNAIAIPLVGLAIVHEERGQVEKALEITEEAIQLFSAINKPHALLICYLNAGTYAFKIGQKEKALDYTAKGKKINESLQNPYYRGSILLAECEWYADEGEFEKAIEAGEEGIHNLHIYQGGVHETKLGYKQLSEAYEKAGKTDKALEYLKKHIHLRDSLENINRAEIMAELDGKFNKAQDEMKIAELSHKSNLQELQNQKNKAILYVSMGASLILLLSLGFAINANRQKKKANKTLQTQKAIIEEKNSEILDSIQYAKRIQNAIIPSDSLISKHLANSFVFYKPKDIVAGDFYWMEEIDGLILLAVADCTGHGVPGAMVSVVCNNALNRAVREFNLKEPAKILDKTREIVIETFSKSEENVKDGMDITLCAWNKKTNKLQYSGANNPLYILPSNKSELEIIAPDKQPVGYYENLQNFTNNEVDLKPGDAVYLFSDGFMDQFGGPAGKKYKYSQFRKFLVDSFSDRMTEQGKSLEKEFYSWKGDLEQLDDVCVIGIRV